MKTQIGRLRGAPGYYYLASPYTKYSAGINSAWIEVCRATDWLIDQGIPVFSPIAHMHAVAINSGRDSLDWQRWMRADEPMMRSAYGLIVCKMPGWEHSHGVKVEIREFNEAGKPIEYLAWPI